MVSCVSELDAKQIAVKFLEQYHNNVLPREIAFEKDTYLITLATGLVEKKTVQVKIDANTALIVGVNYPIDFAKIVDGIFETSNQIRYALIVNSKGSHVYSRMANGKTHLVRNEEQITNLSSDLHILRQLLRMFDESLGSTTFTYFEREKIHVLIFYINDFMVCVSCERSLSHHQIIDIAGNIRKTLEKNINRH